MKFNRVLVAAGLIGIAGGAHAGALSWVDESTDTLTNAFNVGKLAPGLALPGLVGPASGASISLGYLESLVPTTVQITYLGSSAGDDNAVTNSITLNVGAAGTSSIEIYGIVPPPNTVNGVAGVTMVSASTTALSPVPFTFTDQSNVPPVVTKNGDPTSWSPFVTPYSTIGLIGTNMVVGGKTYQYVIGYNDIGGGCHNAGCTSQADWNDFVIGVNAVPEPEVYAMLAAGLGLMGFVARRRKQLQNAA